MNTDTNEPKTLITWDENTTNVLNDCKSIMWREKIKQLQDHK